MATEDLMKAIRIEIAPFLAEAGLELFDCKVTVHHSTKRIDLLIDKPQGGISLDECAEFNRKVSRQMDLDEYLKDFDVNVSSPGLDHPMRNALDFKRVIGRMVRVHMKGPSDGPLQYEGQLKNVHEGRIVMMIGDDEQVIEIQDIQKGVQLI